MANARTNSGLELGDISGMKAGFLYSPNVLTFDLRFHAVTASWKVPIAFGLSMSAQRAASIALSSAMGVQDADWEARRTQSDSCGPNLSFPTSHSLQRPLRARSQVTISLLVVSLVCGR